MIQHSCRTLRGSIFFFHQVCYGAPVHGVQRRPPERCRKDISEQDQAELRLRFAKLKQEHADFDAAIEAMLQTGCNALQIQRMKKKKLAIKDLMSELEDQILPDIIA